MPKIGVQPMFDGNRAQKLIGQERIGRGRCRMLLPRSEREDTARGTYALVQEDGFVEEHAQNGGEKCQRRQGPGDTGPPATQMLVEEFSTQCHDPRFRTFRTFDHHSTVN